MDTAYWNLFWSTGMPEAWLMSRERPEAASAAGAEEAAPQAVQAGPGGGTYAAPRSLT